MNDKQRRFVDEYLIDQNATRAAIAAGYSPKTARVQGSRLLANADISTEIRARQNKLSRELNISAQDKRAKLWQIAQFCSEKTLDQWMEGFIGGHSLAQLSQLRL